MVEILEIQGEEILDEAVIRCNEATRILTNPGENGVISTYDMLTACLAARMIAHAFEDRAEAAWKISEDIFNSLWPHLKK